jgi:hypothetical protein
LTRKENVRMLASSVKERSLERNIAPSGDSPPTPGRS